MKGPVYLAARYSRREELCEYRNQLSARGFLVQARWLDGGHQLSDAGVPIGESGEALVEGDDGSTSLKAAFLRRKFAQDDWEDVSTAEIVISFTEPPRSKATRGGRHVEFGIALAKGSRVIVVGHRENIFHWLPRVEFCPTWEDALRLLAGRGPLFHAGRPTVNPDTHETPMFGGASGSATEILKWIETELYAGMVMLPRNDSDRVWNNAHRRVLGIIRNYRRGEGLFQMTRAKSPNSAVRSTPSQQP